MGNGGVESGHTAFLAGGFKTRYARARSSCMTEPMGAHHAKVPDE